MFLVVVCCCALLVVDYVVSGVACCCDVVAGCSRLFVCVQLIHNSCQPSRRMLHSSVLPKRFTDIYTTVLN